MRQETRSGSTYWYGYRRAGEKMAKRYLGRTSELTAARLEETAAELAEAALRIGPAALARSAARAEMPAQHAMTLPIAPLPSTMAASPAVPPLPQPPHDVRLATKLHMPHLRTQLVQRNRLIERLQRGMEAPLTLVSAPAGSGKTTLLAQWLEVSGRDAAWLSLEPEDNEPMRFLSSVIAALQTLDQHLGSSALALLHTTPPASPPPPEAVLAQLATELLEGAYRDMILVLDDYHVITTKSLQHAVAALVEHAPPKLHLVIATRVDPALSLARLRARGQLCEVRAAHLQFTTEEARTFLGTVMGLDLPAEAVEAALAAHDFVRAARLIDEPLFTSMIMSLQFATLIRWLECFPHEQLFTNVSLCLAYAFSLFGSETPHAHEGPLAVAERLSRAEGNHKRLGQAYTLRAIAARVRGDEVQAIKYGAQAFQLLPEDALLERSTAMSALAEGYQLNGEVVAARRVLAEARSLREEANNIPSILGNIIALGDLLIMQGKLREATDVYAPMLEAADERQYFAIQALIGLGNITYECNELDRAETHLERAITFARKTRDPVLLARASLVRARVIQACGDAERTSEAWASALGLAQECGYAGLVELAQAYQVRGWLKLGRREEAIQWQKASSFAHDAPPSYPQEVLALTLVRCLLAQGEAGEALRMLELWRRHARAQERTGSEIEMLMLSALAYARQGKAEQAVQLLEPALLLASPEGYVRMFVDEGVSMVALLSLILARWKSKPETNYIHALLSVLQAEQPAQSSLSPSAPHWEPPFEPFTDRERKVIRLLAAGLSNAEIAAELVVSVNTIKTQARSIYHKLNVKNRHEAVALARHWRLL